MSSPPLAVCTLPTGPSQLQSLFEPRSVALIGATERAGSVGRAVMENLLAFPGEVFPINARHDSVLGYQTWASLKALAKPVDLVVIATPAAQVPEIIRDCVACGVRAAIIISAGFKETGAAGASLESSVCEEIQHHGLRLIGPNCLGLMVPHIGLNATFATSMARPGRVAFLSQSGALCTAILDWSFRQCVGFSAFVSVGSMLDVGWGDLIRHFGDDPRTESIVIYMESVGDAPAFMEAARLVAGRKPIVVIKVGRTAAAARAAASHTGAMTGSDEVLDAAFERAGVLRVNSIEELFDMAEVLAKQSLPKGPRLAIVTNAGGPGALATDALVNHGGKLAELAESTLNRLDEQLPAHWSHANPVDVLGDASALRYDQAFTAVAADVNTDGLLAVLTPQAMTEPLATAQALIEVTKNTEKPVLASWMGGAAVDSAREALNMAGVPTYDYPDEAARAFQFMWQRHERLRWLEKTNQLACAERPVMGAARDKIVSLQKSGRTLLNEIEAKSVLALAGIPVLETHHAGSENEAVMLAARLGYPVVLKLQSPTITHKTDVGGVHLDLKDEGAVRAAWQEILRSVPSAAFDGVTVQRMIRMRGVELICGCSMDQQFGPVLLFGAGGVWVEILQDRVLMLPPLSPELALDRIRQTRIYHALRGTRNQAPANMEAICDVLVKIGDLVLAAPEILEIDINPLIATADGVIALDARIVCNRGS
jgi:acetyltransferase